MSGGRRFYKRRRRRRRRRRVRFVEHKQLFKEIGRQSSICFQSRFKLWTPKKIKSNAKIKILNEFL
jgi:hypothetical protein